MADYNHQVHEMLEDCTTYKPVTDKRRNPTKRVKTHLKTKLLDLRKNNNLTEAEYKRLRPCDSTPASFYGLPKIHKVQLQPANDYPILPENIATTSVPLRPINSCIGAPTYETSKHLAAILRNLQEVTEYSVKNAKEFSSFIKTQRLQRDETVVSFDVTSLFTSIPVDMAINIVERKLNDTSNWKSHTNLTKGQIVDMLSYVLKNSYFTYGGTQYHQISGCAMGSPVSAVVAELVMQEVEKKALQTSPVQPRWWRRYVDDANACLNKNEIHCFHNHLNSVNKHI